MSVSVFDNSLTMGLFGDPEVSELFSPESQVAHMIAFELALTNALATTDLITGAEADAARDVLSAFEPDFSRLSIGMAKDGVAVPALVKSLRSELTEPRAIHTGATSQDATDTALALTLKELSGLLETRLNSLLAALDGLEARFGSNQLMARTRLQAALEVASADRISAWRAPIAGLRADLSSVSDKACVVQLGGPVGDRAGFADRGSQIEQLMAKELGLKAPGRAWHSSRGAVVGFGDWLSHLTGALGKLGLDIALMAQQGVDDVRLAGGGGSSAMAHKSNPVLAELLVTLARFNSVQVAGLHAALVHEQERSGSAWMLEWMILPQMAAAAGRALNASTDLVAQIEMLGRPN